MENFDVVIIGGVRVGMSALYGPRSRRLRPRWWSKDLGGVCLNLGCIPSKALLRNADWRFLLRTNALSYGIQMDNLSLDYGSGV